jgi:hypothetical protein
VKLVQIVQARELYLKIAREELAPNSPKAFRDAQAQAAEEVKALEPRIAYLTIQVQGTNQPEVVVDGQRLEAALVGVAIPVDPGPHEVSASAPGGKAETRRLTVGEGGKQTVGFTLKAEPSPAATPAGDNATTVAPVGASGDQAVSPTAVPGQADQTPATSGKSGLRVGSYVAFGVGAVGLGVGTFFVLRSAGKRSDADRLSGELAAECGTHCLDTNPKAQQVKSLDSQANSAKTAAIAGYVVGGVGVAAGVTMLLLSSSSKSAEPAKAAEIHPWVGLGSVGLAGQF